MRRTWVLATSIAFALGVPWALQAQETKGVDVAEVGWWSSRPGALAQANNGFEVGAGPDGSAISVAALRLQVPLARVDKLAVSLNESSAFGHELGGLKLCSTEDDWTAANPGPMADAPTANCTLTAMLTRTDDGKWLGDAARLVPNGGEVSLMVVPVVSSPAPVGPGLLVTIAGGEFVATGTLPTSTTQDTTQTTDFSTTTEFFIDDFSGPVVSGSFGTPSFEEPQVALTETTLPPKDARQSEDDFALTPIDSIGPPAKPWIRLIVLIPLSAGFGVGSVRLRRLLDERGLLAG